MFHKWGWRGEGGIFLNCCPQKTSCFCLMAGFLVSRFRKGVLAVQVVVALSVVRFLIDSLCQRLWQLTGGPPVVVGEVAAKRQRLRGGGGGVMAKQAQKDRRQ